MISGRQEVFSVMQQQRPIERQQLTWNAASYLASASATEAVGGSMNQRWTATQRFQSSSEHTFTMESDDCHTCRTDRTQEEFIISRTQSEECFSLTNRNQTFVVQVSRRAA